MSMRLAKRISHAKGVCAYAEELLKKEVGDPTVVIAAALLHDIGIHEAGKKCGSASGKYQKTKVRRSTAMRHAASLCCERMPSA